MFQEHHPLAGILRAIKAEEKQGHINTGAMGGFSTMLKDSIPLLRHCLAAPHYDRLAAIADIYAELSPYKRRGLLAEIRRLLSEAAESLSVPSASEIPIKTSLKTPIKTPVNTPPNIPPAPGKPLSAQGKGLQYIKGVGPERAKQFDALGIHTVSDLFRHYPRRYEVRTYRHIKDLVDGELAAVSGEVTAGTVTRGRIKAVKLMIEQDGYQIQAVWFNQVHILKQFPAGTIVTVTGKVQWNKRVPEILATDIMKGSSTHPGQEVIPVYPETARLNSKAIRTVIRTVLPEAESLFPEYLTDLQGLMQRTRAYCEIHLPSSPESAQKARERLVVEEILFLQLALAQMRAPQKNEPSPVLASGLELVKKFIASLPYALTAAQRRVTHEIFKDMANGERAMTRLLQGDVGSGKTVVAMAAILQAVGSGFQAAFMAPTEVLAQQHYETLTKAFSALDVSVALLAGSQPKAERDQALSRIYGGKVHVVVGTHALIQESVQFNALGLVITDEQHRFGVRQRTVLQDKGENPHVLVMTATPIPRTLALTLYGDLQLSVLDEMPAGRKPIITRRVTERNRPSLEKFMEQQIGSGRQVYVVCPLVEETEKSDLVSATQTAENLSRRFSNRQVALIHGRMKGYEKDDIMRRFRSGAIDILVATTVVEVGVNVPNASVMVIEEAQRFGLAQLHQLRGRVGRGTEQSYCILMSDVKETARLYIMCETEDGFRIAEEDLKLRGPGELLGLRQHGIPELKLADLGKDGKLIEKAYQILQKAVANPVEHQKLYEEVGKIYSLEKVGVN